MIRKLSIVTAVLGVAAFAFSAFAPSASAAAPSRGTIISGRGVLDANGNGLIAVKGSLDMSVSAQEGALLIKDESGDAVVHVEGHGEVTHWNGFTLYVGFNGHATIIGRGVAVIVVGRDIDLHAAGRGWAYLKGTGRYFVNGHGPFPWNNDGGFASVTPPEGDTPTAP